tara:strand:- start:2219 stop:2629 length:411 start_codon:yes stop_codon:yes gene_type:complete
MVLLDERKIKNGYEVAYGCKDNVLKVVRVNSKKMFSKHRSSLEIQKVGLDFHIESLEFEDGVVVTYHKAGLGHSSMLPYPEDSRANELLKEYATEFAEIFASNEKLQGYLPSDFTQLQEYLPSFDAESQVVVDDSE